MGSVGGGDVHGAPGGPVGPALLLTVTGKQNHTEKTETFC